MSREDIEWVKKGLFQEKERFWTDDPDVNRVEAAWLSSLTTGPGQDNWSGPGKTTPLLQLYDQHSLAQLAKTPWERGWKVGRGYRRDKPMIQKSGFF